MPADMECQHSLVADESAPEYETVQPRSRVGKVAAIVAVGLAACCGFLALSSHASAPTRIADAMRVQLEEASRGMRQKTLAHICGEDEEIVRRFMTMFDWEEPKGEISPAEWGSFEAWFREEWLEDVKMHHNGSLIDELLADSYDADAKKVDMNVLSALAHATVQYVLFGHDAHYPAADKNEDGKLDDQELFLVYTHYVENTGLPLKTYEKVLEDMKSGPVKTCTPEKGENGEWTWTEGECDPTDMTECAVPTLVLALDTAIHEFYVDKEVRECDFKNNTREIADGPCQCGEVQCFWTGLGQSCQQGANGHICLYPNHCEHSDCKGGEFCSWDGCLPCDKCVTCWEGVDMTCGTCSDDYPINKDSKCPSSEGSGDSEEGGDTEEGGNTEEGGGDEEGWCIKANFGDCAQEGTKCCKGTTCEKINDYFSMCKAASE